MKDTRRIPEATVARLPLYLRALSDGVERRPGATISSEVLANRAGVNAAQVRKDLSHLGSYGVRGVGYEVAYLVTQIRRELGLDVDRRVAIVGVGNLGRALANYGGFPERRFRIVAAFDSDPTKVGQVLGETVVRGVEDLVKVVRAECVAIGVITTPARFAQSVTDRLVEAGVRSILNFAPTILTVPRGVALRQVDLGVELQILSFYEQHAATRGDGASGVDGLSPLAEELLANPVLAGRQLAGGVQSLGDGLECDEAGVDEAGVQEAGVNEAVVDGPGEGRWGGADRVGRR